MHSFVHSLITKTHSKAYQTIPIYSLSISGARLLPSNKSTASKKFKTIVDNRTNLVDSTYNRTYSTIRESKVFSKNRKMSYNWRSGRNWWFWFAICPWHDWPLARPLLIGSNMFIRTQGPSNRILDPCKNPFISPSATQKVTSTNVYKCCIFVKNPLSSVTLLQPLLYLTLYLSSIWLVVQSESTTTLYH